MVVTRSLARAQTRRLLALPADPQPNSPLAQLPQEILHHIFGYLPLEDRISLSHVCRMFCAYTRSPASGLFSLDCSRAEYGEKNLPLESLIRFTAAWGKSVECLHIKVTFVRSLKVEECHAMFSRFTNLKSCVIYEDSAVVTHLPDSFGRLFGYAHNIDFIRFDNVTNSGSDWRMLLSDPDGAVMWTLNVLAALHVCPEVKYTTLEHGLFIALPFDHYPFDPHPNLRTLVIDKFVVLPTIQPPHIFLQNLVSLTITELYVTQDLKVISQCSLLEHLEIKRVVCPPDLPAIFIDIDASPLANCKRLKYVDLGPALFIHGFPSLPSLADLSVVIKGAHPEEVAALGAGEMDISSSLAVLGKCAQLTWLCFGIGVPRASALGNNLLPIDDVRFLQRCPSLSVLELVGCIPKSLDGLEFCITLRALHILMAYTEPDAQPFGPSPDLMPIASCTRLENLQLGGFWGVKSLGFLSQCAEITRVDLKGLKDLEDVGFAMNLPNLRRLSLEDLTVTSISCLSDCWLLSSLTLENCADVRDVSALAHCPSLVFDELCVEGCGVSEVQVGRLRRRLHRH